MENKTLAAAIRLLARREHSVVELQRKLAQKGHDAQAIEEAIATCQRLGYQCDERYAAALVRVRVTQGYGPLKIRYELQQQVSSSLIDTILSTEQENWLHYALQVWSKKFQRTVNATPQEKSKQIRYLQSRGFPLEVITQLYRTHRESVKIYDEKF